MRCVRKPMLPGGASFGPRLNPIAWCGKNWDAERAARLKENPPNPIKNTERPISSIDNATVEGPVCRACITAISAAMEKAG